MATQADVQPTQATPEQPSQAFARLRKYLPALTLSTLLLAGLVLILVLPLPAQQVSLRVGDVVKQNVRSPRRVTYVSQTKLKQARDAAAASVPDVYEYDPGVAQQQRAQAQMLFTGIANIRADSSLTAEQKLDRIQRLADGIVSATTGKAIIELIASNELSWPRVVTESTRVLDEVLRDRVRPTDLPSIKERLSSRFSADLTPEQTTVAVAIVGDLLRANETLNTAETAKRRKEAQDRVEPVRETIEKGEIVVREGNVVSVLDLEKLEALGLQQARTDWSDVAGAALLTLVLVVILNLYLAFYHPEMVSADRRTIVLVIGLLVLVLAGRIASSSQLTENLTWVYVVPFAVLPMLTALLINQRLAILLAVILGILAGYMNGRAFDAGVIIALGGAIGALSMRRVERLSAFLWSGLVVALTHLVVVLAFFLPSPDLDTTNLALVSILVTASGVLAAAFTVTLFSPLGDVLGVTTVMHLLELAHPSQPLFRRLLLEAPGTYHHSVVISTLAEQAAEAIGADALLARVGAYYHDIGKVVRPYLFIENQVNGANIHDTLDPQTSAQAIMDHVREGLALAKKYRLPKSIQDMIPQHHGTKMTSYFYARAREQGLDIPDQEFRYPGPKPQSREAGILMLADGVEAAVRASRDHSPEAIERIIRDIINAQVSDGQLDECDLTLRDLNKIRVAFAHVLQGVYHPRLDYPAIKPPEATAETPGVPLPAATRRKVAALGSRTRKGGNEHADH